MLYGWAVDCKSIEKSPWVRIPSASKKYLMHKKYQFPINIFIVFEKVNFSVYTSEVLTPNHYLCYIPKSWYYGLNLFLKKELFYSYSFLVEMSVIDTMNYKNFF